MRFEPIDEIEANVMYQYSYWQQGQYAQVQGAGGAGGTFAIPGVGTIPNPIAPANYNGPAIAATDMHAVQNAPDVQWNHSELITGRSTGTFLGQRVSYDGSYWTYADNNGDCVLDNPANQVPGMTAANPVPRIPSQFTRRLSFSTCRPKSCASHPRRPSRASWTTRRAASTSTRRISEQRGSSRSFLPGSFGSPLGLPDPFTYDSKYTLPLLIDSPADEKENSEFVNLTFHIL